MINHKNIQQRSLEWAEIKWGKIGGTLSKGLLIDSDTLFIDILSQKLEEFEPTDSFVNYDMQRGIDLEPFALEYLESYTGIKFNLSGWLQCEENELLGISPDGISEDETIAAETKCLSRKEHTKLIYFDEFPLDYVHQCVHYFTVNPKLESLYFLAFRPESVRPFVKLLTRDSMVNIGTKAKPINRPISEVCELSLANANELLKRINNAIEQFKF